MSSEFTKAKAKAKVTQTPSISESIESIDSNKGSNICGYCNKSFSGSKNLKRHINAVHTKAIEYKCDICPKKYYDPDTLRNHRKTHQGKVHQCLSCQKGFATASELTKHTKTSRCFTKLIETILENQNIDKTPEIYPIITPPNTPENDIGKHKSSKMYHYLF